MKLTMAPTPSVTVKSFMNEQNARQGKQTPMTNLVNTLPVSAGRSFFLVKMKPKRMKITVLAILVQRVVLDIAAARLSPMFPANTRFIADSFPEKSARLFRHKNLHKSAGNSRHMSSFTDLPHGNLPNSQSREQNFALSANASQKSSKQAQKLAAFPV